MQSQQQSLDAPKPDQQPLRPVENKSVFAGYQSQGGAYDELLAADGKPRPYWGTFLQFVDQLGGEEFSRRWDHSQRLIYENGVAYSPYGDPEENARPWELDALPLVIDSNEWESVAAGVAQRAHVLDLVLRDLLGPQRLIKDKVLPPEILFNHPGYRLPFHGQLPEEESYLQFYASDLGRSPDGQWWLLADRTESPSGIGFALENRVVLSRMLPDMFRKCNVKRLAPFFIAFQSALQKLAKAQHENPRVVLYSRGPDNPTYFEDAYLARYLGYTLIEGDDLAVRDNQVWIKTLDGLLPVDVIYRRPNSEACDPLEFSDETTIGVAGLLRTARNGNVAFANALGSGIVESPVFMAFMPRLCKYLTGEDLSLPGIATWWCGEAKSLQHVLANFDNLLVSPAFRHRGDSPAERESLDQISREELRARVEQNPQMYIAQEKLEASTTPVWKEGRPVPEKLILRAFSVAENDSYVVMDGGLARTTNIEIDTKGSIPKGQGSKDAWIIGKEPVEPVTLMTSRDEAIEIRRIGSDLPSRVADNIFWLGRQIERADASARLLRTVVLRLTSETADGTTTVLPPLLRALAEQGQVEPGYALDDIKKSLPDFNRILPKIVFDAQLPGSLRSVFDQAFHTASMVRDRISVDTWRIFVRIDQQFLQPQYKDPVDMTDILTLVNTLIVDLAAIEGMVMESMTRTHVFHFLDIGRRLERALQAVALVRSCFIGNKSVSAELLEAALEIADSVMTYRSRYLSNIQLSAVLDLLITDDTNPRSIAYQLATLEDHVKKLPGDPQNPGLTPYERLLMSMLHAVRMVDIQQISDMHHLGEFGHLDSLLDTLYRELPMLSNEITQRYLVHAGPARKMTSTPVVP